MKPSGTLRVFLRFLIRPISLLCIQLLFVFLAFSAIPGDPARNYLGSTADEGAVMALREKLGYNQPVQQRFINYASDLLKGDLGYSLSESASANEPLLEGAIRTIKLGVIVILFALGFSLLIGLIDTTFPRTRSALLRTTEVVSTVPAFVFALIGAYLVLRIYPPSIAPGDHFMAYLAPAISVALVPSALLAAQLLHSSHQIQESDYYISSRAFGFSRVRSYFQTVLPCSLFVWLENLKNILATVWLLTLIAEFIFSIKGLSSIMVQAVEFKDIPLLQGFVIINCVIFAIAAEFIDLTRFTFRPR